MAEVLGRVVPASLANTETQAFILAGLCFVGTWVLVTKIIQFVFSMIWPFLLIGLCLIFTPNWANTFILEMIPDYMVILKEHYKKFSKYVNSKLPKSKEGTPRVNE